MVGLGLASGDSRFGYARGVSADGSVIVGEDVGGAALATRWTEAGGLVTLGDLPGGQVVSTANDVTADGSGVVGYGRVAGGNQAYLWTEATGMVGLGYLPGGGRYSTATAVSADGSVIVGTSDSALGGRVAYRWTAATGMVDLGGPGFAMDVSSDGAVIVGRGGLLPFRWTAEGGVQDLGDFTSFLEAAGGDSLVLAEAEGTSADGSIIVGYGYVQADSESESHAFVWHVESGVLPLADVLTRMGAEVDGWRLEVAWDVSADGRVIVGTGTDPDGARQAWMAVIPEPGSRLLAALGLCLLAARKGHRRRFVSSEGTLD
jgi:probable HAF family extracellular repeat protein